MKLSSIIERHDLLSDLLAYAQGERPGDAALIAQRRADLLAFEQSADWRDAQAQINALGEWEEGPEQPAPPRIVDGLIVADRFVVPGPIALPPAERDLEGTYAWAGKRSWCLLETAPSGPLAWVECDLPGPR